jgi:hypothetical protein
MGGEQAGEPGREDRGDGGNEMSDNILAIAQHILDIKDNGIRSFRKQNEYWTYIANAAPLLAQAVIEMQEKLRDGALSIEEVGMLDELDNQEAEIALLREQFARVRDLLGVELPTEWTGAIEAYKIAELEATK